MPERMFAFDQRNYRECQRAFRGERDQEYYLGDYCIEHGPTVDVWAERRKVCAYSIIRQHSQSRQSFRRSLSHIRADGADVTVLWLVKRGSLRIAHQSGSSVAWAGEFVITKSTTPFFIECLTDDFSVHETLHIVLPTHEARRLLHAEPKTGFCMVAEGRQFEIAERMLTEVFNDTGELSETSARLLVDGALSVLGDAVESRRGITKPLQTIGGRRLADIERFIQNHLSDPRLSLPVVAAGCAISPRYLCLLLRQHGTSYSQLVWGKRLELAHHWLQVADSRVVVNQVAYRAGFKSAAHFSRMFKQAYKMSPRLFRAAMASQGSMDQGRLNTPTR